MGGKPTRPIGQKEKGGTRKRGRRIPQKEGEWTQKILAEKRKRRESRSGKENALRINQGRERKKGSIGKKKRELSATGKNDSRYKRKTEVGPPHAEEVRERQIAGKGGRRKQEEKLAEH